MAVGPLVVAVIGVGYSTLQPVLGLENSDYLQEKSLVLVDIKLESQL